MTETLKEVLEVNRLLSEMVGAMTGLIQDCEGTLDKVVVSNIKELINRARNHTTPDKMWKEVALTLGIKD